MSYFKAKCPKVDFFWSLQHSADPVAGSCPTSKGREEDEGFILKKYVLAPPLLE